LVYNKPVNIVLLEEHELGRNLSRRDERTVHLLKVLHKKTGDVFEAGILNGMTGTGKIEKVNFDGSIFITVDAAEKPPAKLPVRIAVGFVRPIQLKRLLRDLCSMGIPSIDLLGTDLGEKSYMDTKLLNDGGARAALIEGAVQGRDTVLPELSVFPVIDSWLKDRPWEKNENKRTPLLISMDNIRPEGSISNQSSTRRPAVIAIGPERGWSDRERDLFEDSGFLRLSMGKRALRTETACVAAAALVMGKTCWEEF
jgi:RsmE family RNA methyltransferase